MLAWSFVYGAPDAVSIVNALAHKALTRFGLGARHDSGDLRNAAGDPRGYLVDQLHEPLHPVTALMPSDEGQLLREVYMRTRRETGREAEDVRRAFRRSGAVDAGHWMAHVVEAERGFPEKLAMFWSNHLFVAGFQKGLQSLRGGYENDVIRAHALGRFEDLVDASSRHPAMLVYLDQTVSMGPNSRNGVRRNKGLNENYARELMELHTLGVDGGYDQEDVTSLARLLTGWGLVSAERQPRKAGRGTFRPGLHEPGPHRVMGSRYAGNAAALRARVVADLASHPATARHVAGRMVRYFVPGPADPALVAKLERTFAQTEGDLTALAVTLVEADEAWGDRDMPAAFSAPLDHVIAFARGFPDQRNPAYWVRLAARLGQRPWSATSPAGYEPAGPAWFGSQALDARLDAARDSANRIRPRYLPGDGSALALGRDLMGDALSAETAFMLEGAATLAQGLTILALSPEFLSR